MIGFFRWMRLYFKGGDVVLAKLFATRVMSGKEKYEDVPVPLRPQVNEYLIDEGLGHLITE